MSRAVVFAIIMIMALLSTIGGLIVFGANAFYDPARRALVPRVVPAERLPLATTLDSFAWSLMGAIGASLGGLAVRLTAADRSATSSLCW